LEVVDNLQKFAPSNGIQWPCVRLFNRTKAFLNFTFGLFELARRTVVAGAGWDRLWGLNWWDRLPIWQRSLPSLSHPA